MDCKILLDGDKKTCSAKSEDLRYVKVKCMDSEQWSDFVNGINGGMDV